ncbi:hypothetical protein SEA_ELLIE_1 [Mycobacterium phage Ellie]|uniref:Gene 1 ring forming protein domain-containing protein n=1 Tax=Mycobacterium phage Ellie TaxID=2762405 RepID=A0A7G8LLV4_9CAUD|nr:hypothetical protein I5G88_gp01 [Mycobacterium phage Ellie]QNJ58226.1 hypothetical protein SEA_ELLIE_1 [Mycobacterium phage Ellie]
MIDPDIARARIDVLRLALNTHEVGLADDGATVVETAERFRTFVEDDE